MHPEKPQLVDVNSDSLINQAVINVLAFFDLFDFPLTLFEAWKYLPVRANIVPVADTLDQLVRGGLVSQKNSFYLLAGREEIVRTRVRRYNYARRKIKKARAVSRLFRSVPGVKMIAVGNMIGADNLRDQSDIDFFIVTRQGKIWTARFFCVLIAMILGLRPSPRKTKDTICLSFFVSDQAMDLSGLMLDNDPYFKYWFVGLEAVYDEGGVFKAFMGANGRLRDKFPNWMEKSSKEAVKADGRLGLMEKIFKIIQQRLLAPEIKRMMNKDTRVVVNDSVLKLHVNDRRQEYEEKHLEAIRGIPTDRL